MFRPPLSDRSTKKRKPAPDSAIDPSHGARDPEHDTNAPPAGTAEAADDEEALVEDDDEDLFVQPERARKTLKNRHIVVLSELVHRLVLDCDWVRAEGAYALLVRTRGVDVRLCYALGLEILNHADSTGRKGAEFLQRLINAFPAPVRTVTTTAAAPGSRSGKRAQAADGTAAADDLDKLPAGAGVAMARRRPNAHDFVPVLAAHRARYGMWETVAAELEDWLNVPPYADDDALWRIYAAVLDELAARAEQEGDTHQMQVVDDKRERVARRTQAHH